MPFPALERFLTRLGGRDGEAAALERPATGIDPAALAAAAVEPASPASGRRDRAVGSGETVLVQAVAAKVLHGWLQNRHQTLYPLTVNLRNRRAEEVAVLMRWAAVSLLAGGEPATMGASLRDWLLGAGADAATIAGLDAALAAPPPLHAALAAVSHGDLASHAYVLAILALPPHAAATRPFLDYVAARLGLPPEVVRSAERRYRG